MDTKETKDGIVYICENCKKEAGQIIWNAEKRIWECVRCYYTKKEG